MRNQHIHSVRKRSQAALTTCLVLLTVFAAAQENTETQPLGPPLDMTMFHAEARQVLIGATVWKTEQELDGSRLSEARDVFKTSPEWVKPGLISDLARFQPARGLIASNFHIFDNGAEEELNYFKETDFADEDVTRQWTFHPTQRGTWGTPPWVTPSDSQPKAAFRMAKAFYLIGYAAPRLRPGECHQLKALVAGKTVDLNRKQYCYLKDTGILDEAVQPATNLGAEMRRFAASTERGTVDVSVRTYVFRSSGILHLGEQRPAAIARPAPSAEFTFVIEVHDSKALARVDIATEFNLRDIRWDFRNGASHVSVYVLGLIYGRDGKLVRQFGDVLNRAIYSDEPQGRYTVEALNRYKPHRYDTQIDLPPGQYDVCTVITDGTHFGRARLPFTVERVQDDQLSISDIVLSNVARDAPEILRDATQTSPAPVVPTPLVSNNVQFFPAADAAFNRRDHPLVLYFEIYEPLLRKGSPAVSIAIKVVDLENGRTRELGPLDARKWAQANNAVIPVSVELGIRRLHSGSYRVEVQASDSAGKRTEWRQVEFTVNR